MPYSRYCAVCAIVLLKVSAKIKPDETTILWELYFFICGAKVQLFFDICKR